MRNVGNFFRSTRPTTPRTHVAPYWATATWIKTNYYDTLGEANETVAFGLVPAVPVQ
ncbi:MAG: hypothetical protein L0228_02620 [Planctomycetes bacterium]|nr:hypothetical protein [Planctomycetota bacterium]